MRRVGGMDVADYQFDGNHTIASRSRHPWRKQFNVLVAYASFYNPFRALKAVLTIDPLWKFRIMYQVLGNLGLVRSAWASRGWLGRLKWGRIEKASAAPGPKYPARFAERPELTTGRARHSLLSAGTRRVAVRCVVRTRSPRIPLPFPAAAARLDSHVFQRFIAAAQGALLD